MNLLDQLYVNAVLHQVSSWLLVPVVVVLLALIVYSLYSLGSLFVEMLVERRRYRAYIPELVARLEDAPFSQLTEVVEKSGLLRRQKDDLDELIAYLYLPEDARTEVAKRLLANENLHNRRVLDRTEIASKVAPMLGLMGTLIPLGPGIVALGTGDIATLSSALLVAFDTTVAGLATAVVCFIISRIRQRWYADYLFSMEAAFNALLERASIAEGEGVEVPKVVLSYDRAGKRARAKALDARNADEQDDGFADGERR